MDNEYLILRFVLSLMMSRRLRKINIQEKTKHNVSGGVSDGLAFHLILRANLANVTRQLIVNEGGKQDAPGIKAFRGQHENKKGRKPRHELDLNPGHTCTKSVALHHCLHAIMGHGHICKPSKPNNDIAQVNVPPVCPFIHPSIHLVIRVVFDVTNSLIYRQYS